MSSPIGARKCDSFKAVCTAPSFNKTPVGNNTPPLPYSTWQDLSNSVNTSKNVKFNSKPAYLLDQTEQPSCQGDSAGSCKGVKCGHVNGPVKPTGASSTVWINSKQAVREGDPCTLNGGENPGIYTTTPAPSSAPAKSAAETSKPAVKPETPQEQSLWEQTKAFLGEMKEGYVEHSTEEVEAELDGDIAPAAIKTGQSVGKNVGRLLSQLTTNAKESAEAGNLPRMPRMPSLGIRPGKPRTKPAGKSTNKPADPPTGKGGLRVQGQGGPDDCGIKPYKDQKCPAGQQAHHIVPDYALRFGTRKDADSRIPGMPSLDDGPSICLSGGSRGADADHGKAHRGTDPRINAAGQKADNGPPGAATIGEIIDISTEEVAKVKPHCKEEIKKKTDEAFKNVDRNKYGRTTQSLPKEGTDARSAMKRGDVHDNGGRFKAPKIRR